MSMTEPHLTSTPRGNDIDLNTRPRRETVGHRTWRETKPSPKTTELWLMVVGVAVLAVIYNAADDASLNLFRACLLGTIMASAYIVSRGFAKAGSHDDDDRVDTYERRP